MVFTTRYLITEIYNQIEKGVVDEIADTSDQELPDHSGFMLYKCGNKWDKNHMSTEKSLLCLKELKMSYSL